MVEDKDKLMARMGQKQLVVHLFAPLDAIPDALSDYGLTIGTDGQSLIYGYDTKSERTGITRLLQDVAKAGLQLTDVETRQSSLEDIFVSLVHKEEEPA